MNKNIKKEELGHIAQLSMLNVNEEEKDTLLCELGQMLDFASQISEVDNSKAQKERRRLFSLSELREDTVSSPLSREEILSNAPTRTDTYVTIPRIIED